MGNCCKTSQPISSLDSNTITNLSPNDAEIFSNEG